MLVCQITAVSAERESAARERSAVDRGRRGGRLSKSKPEARAAILERLHAGDSLPAASRHAGVDYATVHHWVRQGERFPNGALSQFATEVRQAQAQIKEAKAKRRRAARAELRAVGRPTKCTRDARLRIYYALTIGCSWQAASEYAGVSESTVEDWLGRGNREGEGLYYEFAVRARRA